MEEWTAKRESLRQEQAEGGQLIAEFSRLMAASAEMPVEGAVRIIRPYHPHNER